MSKKKSIILTPSDRATLCLQGLSVGDAFGGALNRHLGAVDEMILSRKLPAAPWQIGDDTVMAQSIYHNLLKWGKINQDALAYSMAKHYEENSTRGYSGTEHRIFRQILNGEAREWETAAKSILGGKGSAGLAAAPRAAIIGAYFAEDTLESNVADVIQQARLAAQITHYHPEGQATAIAVALAAYFLTHAGKDHVHGQVGQDMLEFVAHHTPDKSQIRERLTLAMSMDASRPLEGVVKRLGNGSTFQAADAVPFALWCAARFLDDYGEALWRAATGGGARDANCAIVGALVALTHGIRAVPLQWLERREPLPQRYDHKT